MILPTCEHCTNSLICADQGQCMDAQFLRLDSMQSRMSRAIDKIFGFTGCNTCPNLAECHKSGYCVEQIAKQQKQQ